MGLGVGIGSEQMRNLNVDEMKKDDDEIEVTGCWIKFRFLGKCISMKSKVESSVCGTNNSYGNLLINLFMP